MVMERINISICLGYATGDHMNPEEILKELTEGNERFVNNEGKGLEKHVVGQNPIAIVLTCSDSRVIPEKIFDSGVGEIFTIRVAGNVAFEASVIQSIEYAVSHLKVGLIAIMGHSHCGAVKAAVESGESAEGILKEIRESFSHHESPVIANILRQTELIPQRSHIVKEAIEGGQLRIQPALYDIGTGRVELL
jgi:carbonic anhydrase